MHTRMCVQEFSFSLQSINDALHVRICDAGETGIKDKDRCVGSVHGCVCDVKSCDARSMYDKAPCRVLFVFYAINMHRMHITHHVSPLSSIPPDRLLGEVRVPLKEYDAGTIHDCWFKLSRIRDEHMVPTHATVHLRFSYQLSEDTEMYAALDSSYASLLEVSTRVDARLRTVGMRLALACSCMWACHVM